MIIYDKVGENMKKNIKILFILVAFICAFAIKNVYAEGLCTNSKYDDLKSKANKIKASWELNFDNEKQPYFTVKLENVDENLILTFNNHNYIPDDGVINVEEYLMGGGIYDFKIYGGYQTDCVEEYVYTKKVRIPKYNRYSEMKECKEYPEWELCDKWYSGEIESEEDFRNQLNTYLNSGKKEETKKEDNKSDNSYIAIIIVVVIILTVCFILYSKYQKGRKKVKNEKK